MPEMTESALQQITFPSSILQTGLASYVSSTRNIKDFLFK